MAPLMVAPLSSSTVPFNCATAVLPCGKAGLAFAKKQATARTTRRPERTLIIQPFQLKWTGWFEIRRSRSRNIFGRGAHGLIAYIHAVHFNACRRPNCAAQRTANLSVRRRHPTLCLKAFLFQTTTVGATAPPTQPVALN